MSNFKQFDAVYNIEESIDERRKMRALRRGQLASAVLNKSSSNNADIADVTIKVAFDTRRIDQLNQFNPRRGLQNYNRSENFITEAMSQKIVNFKKLYNVMKELQSAFGSDHNWQDSYARVLLNSLEHGLRINEKDGDYSQTQTSPGGFGYLEELLYVRYRLNIDSIEKLSTDEIKKIILSKDEKLIRKDPMEAQAPVNEDKVTADKLINTLLNVKVSNEIQSILVKINSLLNPIEE